MLKQPGGLERLAEYSAQSSIPSEFAHAVDAIWPRVKSYLSPYYVDDSKFHLEMAVRLFRSSHPFTHELEAQHAIYFGKSVGLVKELTSETDPDLILQSILGRRTFREYEIMEKIFNSWGIANGCESRGVNDGWRVLYPWQTLWRASHSLEVKLGYAAGPEHLKKVPPFLEEYFSDPSHRRDMIFHAQLV